ncbi:TIGR00270 family protein [Candidatus Woesearchaeota archaeon]|nr:TIGR00270 family protein [Candidatus Woesearchaeota archaeon]
MNCEMCGKKEAEYKTIVEGTELTVCAKCSAYGKVIRKPQLAIKTKQKEGFKKQEKPEKIEKIVIDYGQKIRKARTKKEMTQEEFAKKLNIKESLLTKIENSVLKPSIPLARKLEKILKIRLVEEIEDNEKVEIKSRKTEAVTIGDLIDLE